MVIEEIDDVVQKPTIQGEEDSKTSHFHTMGPSPRFSKDSELNERDDFVGAELPAAIFDAEKVERTRASTLKPAPMRKF